MGNELRELMRAGRNEEMASLVSDELLDLFCVVAPSWSDFATVARERYEGVVDRISS